MVSGGSWVEVVVGWHPTMTWPVVVFFLHHPRYVIPTTNIFLKVTPSIIWHSICNDITQISQYGWPKRDMKSTNSPCDHSQLRFPWAPFLPEKCHIWQFHKTVCTQTNSIAWLDRFTHLVNKLLLPCWVCDTCLSTWHLKVLVSVINDHWVKTIMHTVCINHCVLV